VHGWNAGEGEIFRTLPDRPQDLPTLLYNGRRVLFPGLRRPGRSVNHTDPFSAEVKERAELYSYSLQGLYDLLHWKLHHRFTLPGLKPIHRTAIVAGFL